MGWEYKIKFQPIEPERIDQWLRGHACFDRFDSRYGAYEFRRPSNSNRMNMPNLDVRIEDDGVYVNNLDSGLMMYEIANIFLVEYERIELVCL